MPLWMKILFVILYFATLLCYGFDIYFHRIDAGDSVIEAFKAGAIVSATFFFLSSIVILYVSLIVDATIGKRCNG